MLLTALLVLAALQQPAATPALDAPRPVIDWATVRDGARVRLEDGVFDMTGGEGWLRAYSDALDYRLTVQFQLGSADAHGAILVRADHDRPRTAPNIGYRINIRGATTSRAREPMGTITAYRQKLTVRTAPQPTTIDDQWHTMTVDVIGDRISVCIDGSLVSEVEGSEGNAGYIGMEHQSGTLRFRNPTIAPLVEPASGASSVALPLDMDVFMSLPDVVRPKVTREVRPRYTSNALYQKVQGIVTLTIVIDETGNVAQAHVTTPLHPELDVEARAAVRKWRFSPALLNGKAVPVRAKVELEFGVK